MIWLPSIVEERCNEGVGDKISEEYIGGGGGGGGGGIQIGCWNVLTKNVKNSPQSA